MMKMLSDQNNNAVRWAHVSAVTAMPEGIEDGTHAPISTVILTLNVQN
jgi:hypothetical protein